MFMRSVSTRWVSQSLMHFVAKKTSQLNKSANNLASRYAMTPAVTYQAPARHVSLSLCLKILANTPCQLFWRICSGTSLQPRPISGKVAAQVLPYLLLLDFLNLVARINPQRSCLWLVEENFTTSKSISKPQSLTLQPNFAWNFCSLSRNSFRTRRPLYRWARHGGEPR